jgi:hypothetical protein
MIFPYGGKFVEPRLKRAMEPRYALKDFNTAGWQVAPSCLSVGGPGAVPFQGAGVIYDKAPREGF